MKFLGHFYWRKMTFTLSIQSTCFLLLLSTLLNLYSNRYLGIISMLVKVFNLEIHEAKRYKEIYLEHLRIKNKLPSIYSRISNINFWILSRQNKKVVQNMEEYIKLLQEKKDVNYLQYLSFFIKEKLYFEFPQQ